MQELSSNRLEEIRRLHKERIETLNKLATFQVYSITQHIVWLKVRPCNVEFYMTFLPLFWLLPEYTDRFQKHLFFQSFSAC